LEEVQKFCLNFTSINCNASVPGTPVTFSKPLDQPTPPPMLGEHTVQILQNLQYSDSKIQILKDLKIIQTC
jgi:crotonobetainyl-CoA:carnitine CoA-transferase CaiB-like acyl-CoA transferase